MSEVRKPHLSETEPRQHDAAAIRKNFYRELPMIAQATIESGWWYAQPDDPYRTRFWVEPNDPLMHESDWHQWGVITHTVMTGQYLEEKVPELLERWFGPEQAATKFGLLNEQIDGLSKWDLLTMSVPLHDLGKFAQRQYKGMKDDGIRPDFGFRGHEAVSGKIVRGYRHDYLKLGLTPNQIEYLASCAELHYELGKIRNVAKDSPEGYTLQFVNSPSFSQEAETIRQGQPDYQREMGLIFIADSLGKTEIHTAVGARTDAELARRMPQIQAEVAQRNLPPTLAKAALQVAINLRAGERYLALVGKETGLLPSRVREKLVKQPEQQPLPTIQLDALLAVLPEETARQVLYQAIITGQTTDPNHAEKIISSMERGHNPLDRYRRPTTIEIVDFAYRWHSLERALGIFTQAGLFAEAAAFAKAKGAVKQAGNLTAQAHKRTFEQRLNSAEKKAVGEWNFKEQLEAFAVLIQFKRHAELEKFLPNLARMRRQHNCVANKHEHNAGWSEANRAALRSCRALDARAAELEGQAWQLLGNSARAQEQWLDAAHIRANLDGQVHPDVIALHDRAGSHITARWLRNRRLATKISDQERLDLYQTLAQDYARIGSYRESVAMRKAALKLKIQILQVKRTKAQPGK